MMDKNYLNYLSISPRARRDYLNFIVELSDIAIRNVGNNGITEETAAKASICREDALSQLEQLRDQHDISSESR